MNSPNDQHNSNKVTETNLSDRISADLQERSTMKLIASCLAWVTFALLTRNDVTAEILGYPPPTHTCLCSTGDRVAARDGPCLKGCETLVRLYRGDCFRFRGSVRSADGYRWFQLENVDGLNLWTVGKYLTIGHDSQCSRKCYRSEHLACRVLNRNIVGSITLSRKHAESVEDGATAYDNILDTCYGKRAARSRFVCGIFAAPGGDVCLDPRVLKFILGLDSGNEVVEVAGGCNKDTTSPSYLGRGVTLAKKGDKGNTQKLCEALGGELTDDGNFLYCRFPAK